MQGCAAEGYLNCLFTIIGLPLGLFMLGYGAILIVQGKADYGVFLGVLGLLLLGAVLSGLLSAKSRNARKAGKERKKRG